jgi:hypothetical protein
LQKSSKVMSERHIDISTRIRNEAAARCVGAVLFHVVKLDLVDVHDGLHFGALR